MHELMTFCEKNVSEIYVDLCTIFVYGAKKVTVAIFLSLFYFFLSDMLL
jgi:hypothetical protein